MVYVMWTTTGKDMMRDHWAANHFVQLLSMDVIQTTLKNIFIKENNKQNGTHVHVDKT